MPTRDFYDRMLIIIQDNEIEDLNEQIEELRSRLRKLGKFQPIVQQK